MCCCIPERQRWATAESSLDTLPELSLSEIRKHDGPDKLWMIFYNYVYDVTTLAEKHPGGAEVLFDCGGVDATQTFEDVGHSKTACEMLSPYVIGKVPKSAEKCYKLETPEKAVSKSEARKKKGRKSLSSEQNTDKVLILLAILALLACASFLGLQKLKWENIVS